MHSRSSFERGWTLGEILCIQTEALVRGGQVEEFGVVKQTESESGEVGKLHLPVHRSSGTWERGDLLHTHQCSINTGVDSRSNGQSSNQSDTPSTAIYFQQAFHFNFSNLPFQFLSNFTVLQDFNHSVFNFSSISITAI